MENNIKYPVRYVILGLRDKHKAKNLIAVEEYYGDEYAYVVVKALVINEIKTYDVYGGYTTSYDVVPEWKQDEYGITPKYNLYGRCYNTVNVESEKVFHELDRAKRYCRELNIELLDEKLKDCNPEIASFKKIMLKEKMLEAENLQNEQLNISKKR